MITSITGTTCEYKHINIHTNITLSSVSLSYPLHTLELQDIVSP